MTLQDMQAMINERFSDVAGQTVRSSINQVISKMNLKLEGERVSVIAVNNSNKLSGEFAGGDGPPGELIDEGTMYLCNATAGDYTIGEVWEYDGVDWSVVNPVSGDVYWAYVALSTAEWAQGESRSYSYSDGVHTWTANGFLWIDHRLTLKSNILRVLDILIGEEPWSHRAYSDIDEDNDYMEYYEENRGVLRFNDYYSGQGDMRVISMNGITRIAVNSSPATVIDFPEAWESVFLDGLIARVAGYLKDEKDTFGLFYGMYKSGLNSIKEFESNRLPYAYVRKSE